MGAQERHKLATADGRASRLQTTHFRAWAQRCAVGAVSAAPLALAALLGVGYLAFAGLPPVPEPAENPITEEKRVLGKILFWDEQLSTSNVVSCGTCHQPRTGGADPRLARNPGLDGVFYTADDSVGSPGIVRSDESNNYFRDPAFGLSPQVTPRSANVNINAGYSPLLFWDGRAKSKFNDPETGAVAIGAGGALESQAVGPVLSSVEMAHAGMDWPRVSAKLARVRPLDLASNLPADMASALNGGVDYPELFRRAFGDPAISAKRIAFAIATYQRTLVSDESPWDAYDAGDLNALTPSQVRGMQVFEEANCNFCHTPPLFTNDEFHNIGLRPVIEDIGRQAVTGLAADAGKFKSPTLRNVGLKRNFMHNGALLSMNEVIRFYGQLPGARPQVQDNIDIVMQAVVIAPEDVAPLEDFVVNALTDRRVAEETFPFDRPELYTQRPSPISIVGQGVSGANGVVPAIILEAPPMVGNLEFRIGVDRVPAGAAAQLVLGFQAQNGQIVPAFSIPLAAADSNGTATTQWPLFPGRIAGGQSLYAQWIIADPAAPGGQSRSAVAKIDVFCGRSGCPPTCTADFNHDGDVGTDADIEAFFACLAGNCCPTCGTADFNGDGDTGTDADIEAFFRVLAGGPC